MSTITPIPELPVPATSTKDWLGSIRKAVVAGIGAGFAAGAGSLAKVYVDNGAIIGDDIVAAILLFLGAAITVGWTTWGTANKATPADTTRAINQLTAVPPIVVQAPEGALNPEYVGFPDLPTDPEGHVQDLDDDEPKHRA